MTAFVRIEMLKSMPPQAENRGGVHWMRKNLFSSPLNSILSVITVVLIGYLTVNLAIWLSHGIWNASSLYECREQIAGAFGPDAAGPCWAMIRHRWNQFLFGLYPADAYWRPAVALALFTVSLAPVLCYGIKRQGMMIVVGAAAFLLLALWGVGARPQQVVIAGGVFLGLLAVAALRPTKLIWLTLAYPFAGYWLLWGGSVWSPIGLVAATGILSFVWTSLQWRLGNAIAGGIACIAAGVWWFGVQATVTNNLAQMLPIELPYVRSGDFGGFLLAFVIGITAIAASLPFGIVLALARRSDMFLVRTLAVAFIEFIRGVPLITVLFAANFMLLYFLPPRTNFDLILRVIIVVIVFSSAYIAEVIRGGLAALPTGQYEAADALGLDYWQAQRLIIMPQAVAWHLIVRMCTNDFSWLT